MKSSFHPAAKTPNERKGLQYGFLNILMVLVWGCFGGGLILFGEVLPVFANPPVLPQTPPLQISIPAFDLKTLPCGLKILFLKDDSLPLVSGNLMIPGGSAGEPEGQEGVAGLAASLMRDGGAGKLAPEAFDEALENKAASMTSGSDLETLTAGFNCMAGDLDEVLGLFADMVRRPQFDAKRLETDRSQMIEGLDRSLDVPDDLTRTVFYRALYGDHPYGRTSTPESLGRLTREEVKAFYQNHYGPQGSVLVLAGNFDEAKVLARLTELFGGWAAQSAPAVYGDPAPPEPTIYFYPKEVSQVFIRLGYLGLKRHDPNDIPLQVANYVLGGSGFASRLMAHIRSDRGLAYFVETFFQPKDVKGFFELVGGTRPDAVKEFLTLSFQMLGDYAKTGPTPAELASAKKSMIEEYAYNFESPFTLASYKASLDFHGYPSDYLSTYRDQIQAVTQAQAAKAVQGVLDPSHWVLVVCGPAALEKDLESFGKVVVLKDIFGPLAKGPEASKP
ncbi:MAG TPA: pitrilysin family protein [bacterium]|nr:pitrilysin family protein [bacterium]